jgi:hypothetical protein
MIRNHIILLVERWNLAEKVSKKYLKISDSVPK